MAKGQRQETTIRQSTERNRWTNSTDQSEGRQQTKYL